MAMIDKDMLKQVTHITVRLRDGMIMMHTQSDALRRTNGATWFSYASCCGIRPLVRRMERITGRLFFGIQGPQMESWVLWDELPKRMGKELSAY